MIRILLGIMFLSRDTMRFPNTSTNITASDITMAVLSCTVMASAEQIPST